MHWLWEESMLHVTHHYLHGRTGEPGQISTPSAATLHCEKGMQVDYHVSAEITVPGGGAWQLQPRKAQVIPCESHDVTRLEAYQSQQSQPEWQWELSAGLLLPRPSHSP